MKINRKKLLEIYDAKISAYLDLEESENVSYIDREILINFVAKIIEDGETLEVGEDSKNALKSLEILFDKLPEDLAISISSNVIRRICELESENRSLKAKLEKKSQALDKIMWSRHKK